MLARKIKILLSNGKSSGAGEALIQTENDVFGRSAIGAGHFDFVEDVFLFELGARPRMPALIALRPARRQNAFGFVFHGQTEGIGGGFDLRRRVVAIGAAQMGHDARHQNRWSERLREIIVGADFKGRDFGAFVVWPDHQHRNRAFLAHRAAKRLAVDGGARIFHQKQMRIGLVERRHAAFGVCGVTTGEAGALQKAQNEACRRFVVFQ